MPHPPNSPTGKGEEYRQPAQSDGVHSSGCMEGIVCRSAEVPWRCSCLDKQISLPQCRIARPGPYGMTQVFPPASPGSVSQIYANEKGWITTSRIVSGRDGYSPGFTPPLAVGDGFYPLVISTGRPFCCCTTRCSLARSTFLYRSFQSRRFSAYRRRSPTLP